MAYEYKRFKKNKASIIPIEEIYTDLDINANDPYAPNVGYRFDSPRRWCNDSSANKSIGIRDLHLTPSSGDIRCRFLSYANVKIRGRKYDWDSDGDVYVSASTTSEDDVINCRCLSDIYNIQITPQNGFEEIITSILNFVNGSSWRLIHNVSNSYKTYKPSYHDTARSNLYMKRNNDGTDEGLSYITNKNFLKLPVSFIYYFDSDTSYFECKNNNFLRWVLMANYSASYNEETENDPIFESLSTNTHYYYYDGTDSPFSLTTKKDSHDTVYLTDGRPKIASTELVLIIRRDDEPAIKAVYDLFNQKMPDINTLPTVEIDGHYYVIPFQSIAFQSHFKFGEIVSNALTNVQTEKTPAGFTTNLKLNTVWDRLKLVYHASFSETRHRIIGRNNDHWDSPNKQFIVPSTDQDQFYIRFTTDGIHNILPIGCHFNIDLCFMLNPSKNTATGINQSNHDSFKD